MMFRSYKDGWWKDPGERNYLYCHYCELFAITKEKNRRCPLCRSDYTHVPQGFCTPCNFVGLPEHEKDCLVCGGYLESPLQVALRLSSAEFYASLSRILDLAL